MSKVNYCDLMKMETFLECPQSLRFLVLADVDMMSVTKLSEHFIHLSPQFDCIIVIGPHGLKPSNSAEDTAVALGDMASIIAQLENIVCRVIYLPTEMEPSQVLTEQLHLTPNSVNIHGRRINLLDDMFVLGYSERSENFALSKCETGDDDNEDGEATQVLSGTAINIIEKLLVSGEHQQPLVTTEGNSILKSVSPPALFGLFALQYYYSHTLNHVLFHMMKELTYAQIKVCLLSSRNVEELNRLPTTLGGLSLVNVKSLQQGFYSVLEIQRDQSSDIWKVFSNNTHAMI